jgi:hypothetical protein
MERSPFGPMAVAERSKPRAVSNPTRHIDVCLRSLCVYDEGLATDWSPVERVLQISINEIPKPEKRKALGHIGLWCHRIKLRSVFSEN